MASPRELDIYDLSRPREGDVDRRVRWMVTTACIVTMLIVVVVPRVVAHHDRAFDNFWFQNALAIAVGVVIAFGWLPIGKLSRSVRLAVMLPSIHLGAMIVAWAGWSVVAPMIPDVHETVPLLKAVPIAAIAGLVAASIVIAGWWIGRFRRGETIHAIVMVALVDLLLLGLWIPIVALIVSDNDPSYLFHHRDVATHWELLKAELASPARLIALVLVPPLLGAIAYTLIAIRRRRWLPKIRGLVIVLVVFAATIAFSARVAPTDLAAVVYVNFVPWLVAAAAVTIAAITALSIATWRAARIARGAGWRQITGRIAGERGAQIAVYEIASWLRGPRAITKACEVITQHGTVPVPAGAHLHAPLPLSSTMLRGNEGVVVLRAGDEVALGGYAQHATGQPFRDSAVPIPGDDGIAIGPAAAGGDEGQLALVAWRPSLAYLVILVIVAVPALVTAFQPN